MRRFGKEGVGLECKVGYLVSVGNGCVGTKGEAVLLYRMCRSPSAQRGVGLEQQRWPRRREVTQQEDAMMGHRGEREPEESRTILNSGARAWLAGGATNQAEEIQGRKRVRREEKEFS